MTFLVSDENGLDETDDFSEHCSVRLRTGMQLQNRLIDKKTYKLFSEIISVENG